MAMQNGLSAAIINPNSEDMMRAYFSYCALAGLDENCQDYIARYAGQTTAAPAAAKGDLPLQECIRKGLKEQTAAATAALLKTTAPLDVINQELIPALDVVGKGFEKGTVFLPQLLMSAEAAKAAFDVIKQQMADSGVVQEKKGKIILATVKGDIHDIGKNIVKVLLENYSYDVIDLGRDVPPETIVETALAQQVKLVGLSALMTTTVPSMEETIRQLNAADPTIKVMVGGRGADPGIRGHHSRRCLLQRRYGIRQLRRTGAGGVKRDREYEKEKNSRSLAGAGTVGGAVHNRLWKFRGRR